MMQLPCNSALHCRRIFVVACCFKGGRVQFGSRVFVPDGAQLAASFASGCPCTISKLQGTCFSQLVDGSEQPHITLRIERP